GGGGGGGGGGGVGRGGRAGGGALRAGARRRALPALHSRGLRAPAARVRRRGARAAARRLTALLDARPARGVRIRNPGYESGTRGAPRDPDPAAGSRARAGAWPRCLPVVIFGTSLAM